MTVQHDARVRVVVCAGSVRWWMLVVGRPGVWRYRSGIWNAGLSAAVILDLIQDLLHRRDGGCWDEMLKQVQHDARERAVVAQVCDMECRSV